MYLYRTEILCSNAFIYIYIYTACINMQHRTQDCILYYGLYICTVLRGTIKRVKNECYASKILSSKFRCQGMHTVQQSCQ